jgi:hypothetical protein
MWTAVFINTCKDCLRLHGKVKTRLEWEQGGVIPGSGQTICGLNCKCSLLPIETMRRSLGVTDTKRVTDPKGGSTLKPKSEKEIIKEINQRSGNGIKLQRKRVEEMAKKRGKQYSEEYKNQLLGQVQGERFNPYFESQQRTNLYLRKFPKTGVTKKFKEEIIVR